MKKLLLLIVSVLGSAATAQQSADDVAKEKLKELGWQTGEPLRKEVLDTRQGRMFMFRDSQNILTLDSQLQLVSGLHDSHIYTALPLHGFFLDDQSVEARGLAEADKLGLVAKHLSVKWPSRANPSQKSGAMNIVTVLGDEGPGLYVHPIGFGNSFSLGFDIGTGQLREISRSYGWTYANPAHPISCSQAVQAASAFLTSAGIKSGGLDKAAKQELMYLAPASEANATESGFHWRQEKQIRVGYLLLFEGGTLVKVDGETAGVLEAFALNAAGADPDAGSKLAAYILVSRASSQIPTVAGLIAAAAAGLYFLVRRNTLRRAKLLGKSSPMSSCLLISGLALACVAGAQTDDEAKCAAQMHKLGWIVPGKIVIQEKTSHNGRTTYHVNDLFRLSIDSGGELVSAAHFTAEFEPVPLHSHFRDDAHVLAEAKRILQAFDAGEGKYAIHWPLRPSIGSQCSIVQVTIDQSPGKYHQAKTLGNSAEIYFSLVSGDVVHFAHGSGWSYNDPPKLISPKEAENAVQSFFLSLGLPKNRWKVDSPPVISYCKPAWRPESASQNAVAWTTQKQMRVAYTFYIADGALGAQVDAETGEVLDYAIWKKGESFNLKKRSSQQPNKQLPVVVIGASVIAAVLALLLSKQVLRARHG